MMLTYEEIISLRNKLLNDEISPKNAHELYFNDTNENIRHWHTKDWKERRDKIIKDKCEQCGSTKKVFSLQIR